MKKSYRVAGASIRLCLTKIAETFIQYVITLAPDEIEQLDADLEANDWGVRSIVEIEDCVEFLKLFQLCYYFN